MYLRAVCVAGCVGVALLLSACEKPREANIEEIKTYPAKGHVTLNGKPAAGVSISVHPKADVDAANPPGSYTTYHGVVQDDGSVAFATYKSGDGLPEGEYVLTLEKREFEKGKITLRGASRESRLDELAGKYSAPAKSQWTLTVVPNGPNDAGTIELEVSDEELKAAEEAAAGESRLQREEDP